MHGVWGQDKVVLWLSPGHLWDAGEQNLLSLAYARCYLGESGGRGSAVVAWQEDTGPNMPLAWLEAFGRCDERLLSVLPLWICNLKRGEVVSHLWAQPATALRWHDIASAPSLGCHALPQR
jgi:hypothetical protein